MTKDFKEIWETLSAINVNAHTQDKGKFTYLSWTWAWSTLMQHYPEATYEIHEVVFYPDGTAEVGCTVDILGHSRTMWLPVMDNKNFAKKDPNARDIGDSKMRVLVKCLAMFGLGHYIYAGEDLPEPSKGKESRAVYEHIQAMLRDAAHLGEKDLRAWMNEPDHIEAIKSLPSDWQQELKDEIKTYLKTFEDLKNKEMEAAE